MRAQSVAAYPPFVAQDHFTTLIEQEMAKCEKSALRVTLGDSLRHAKVQGAYEGLEMALKLYREAIKRDIVGDIDHDKEAA